MKTSIARISSSSKDPTIHSTPSFTTIEFTHLPPLLTSLLLYDDPCHHLYHDGIPVQWFKGVLFVTKAGQNIIVQEQAMCKDIQLDVGGHEQTHISFPSCPVPIPTGEGERGGRVQ